jgi:malonyl-CoA/methylmalonyl-CoA synthetase
MPEKTREEFTADGWFRTGDIGTFDADGYLSIVGRAKDLIITGGYNVYPKEIEQVIDELPGVLESAVIGVPHADFGEAVTAVVVAAAGAQIDTAATIEALKKKLAAYKVPKSIYVVEALPRNAMGKVQKNVLRERLGQ